MCERKEVDEEKEAAFANLKEKARSNSSVVGYVLLQVSP